MGGALGSADHIDEFGEATGVEVDKGRVEPPPEEARLEDADDAVLCPDGLPAGKFTWVFILSTIPLEVSYAVYRTQLKGSPGGGGSGRRSASS